MGFEIMLAALNAQIQEMNNRNLKVYDVENPGHYLTLIQYNKEKDLLEFKCNEE